MPQGKVTYRRGLTGLIKDTAADFSADDAMSLAAAVAFYTALSFAPLVLLVVSIGGFLGDSTRNDLLRMFEQQLGPSAADATKVVVETAAAQTSRAAWWQWALSTGGLLVTASGVFAQLQASLNRIWDVQAKPEAGIWGWLRKRLLSMGMVLALLFILLISLVASAAVAQVAGGTLEALGWLGDAAASVAVATLVFATMFKVLPDVKLRWSDVWLGAAITAVLFTVGKVALAIYLDRGGVGASYGKAAGGLIALLVWVYYSSTILLVGAEVTQQIARRRGHGLEAAPHSAPKVQHPSPVAPPTPPAL